MSWFISLFLAGSMMVSGNNLPVSEHALYENQGVPAYSKYQETERFEKLYSFDPNGRIRVSNLNGSITIEAWDNPQIYIEAIKTADSKERLEEVNIKVDESPTDFRVEADYDSWNRRTKRIYKNKGDRYGMLKVDFRLKVPRTAMLNKIETVNGSVKVSDMTKYTDISAVNGGVRGTNLRGTAKLSTVNGSVLADFDRLENRSVVSLETVNGSVKLIVPSDVNAVIRAETLNGSIKNSFGLPVKKGEYVGRDLYGKVGDNSLSIDDYSKIKLSSVNGGLTIERKDDGKAPNPATNLLQDKGSDDFDIDFESGLKDAFREVDADLREAKRDVAEARREVREARRTARAEAALERAKLREAKRLEKMKTKPVTVGKIDTEAFEEAMKAVEKANLEISPEVAGLRDAIITRSVESQLRIPAVEQEVGTFSIEGIPTIRIEAENCVVSIRGWEKSKVDFTLTKISKDQISKAQNKEAVKFRAEQNDTDEVAIEVQNKNAGEDEYRYVEPTQVQLEVFVPKKSSLRIVTNDELRLEGVSGDLILEGGGKMLNLRDIGGDLTLRSDDGLTRLIGFNGNLDSEIGDGEMYLEGNFKTINARAADGIYNLLLPENTNALLETNTKLNTSGNLNIQSNKYYYLGGLKFEKECDNVYRFGKGEAKYKFEFAEGKLILREKESVYLN